MERVDETNYFIRKFPLIGSVLKLQRPEKINFGIIDKLARKYRVFQIIIEPDLGSGPVTVFDHKLLLHNGFKLSKSPYLPSKTLQIDLTQPKEKIYTNFTKECRYTIRKAAVAKTMAGKGVGGFYNSSCSTPAEIIKWREAWKNSVKFNRYVPSAKQLLNIKKSFPQNHSLFLASHNISGRITGGALFTVSSHDVSNHITYYWYGFTNKEGRASLSQYSLLYQGILWAKKMGCKVFDFEGVYDSRFPNKSWLGFTHFKRSFGGREVLYPGAYTKNVLSFGLWNNKRQRLATQKKRKDWPEKHSGGS
ncbi:MAG: Methicillin resistance protein [Microgenomates group bacterium GW2011_GWC1_39_7b]|uniref:Methicillin resistance protein n=1 Tax=Candidatus Woesebacteria bacterium GW2011_GWA2_40_7 TaxID=1618562 RepID=A0A0G0VQV7_9BACT|nr:MAG: Methicillin resistance protein [Microgenomates group bacterium GW2011_GWC1_39_7b]KKR74315.1 MAG: Methicillin resistance protein [Candidatus Woesebacteria bacterium GW2011_GWA2_40_7]